MNTVTIRIGIRTKAALEIFAAKESVREGHALTNDQAIMRLLELVDKEVVEQVKRLEKSDDKGKST